MFAGLLETKERKPSFKSGLTEQKVLRVQRALSIQQRGFGPNQEHPAEHTSARLTWAAMPQLPSLRSSPLGERRGSPALWGQIRAGYHGLTFLQQQQHMLPSRRVQAGRGTEQSQPQHLSPAVLGGSCTETRRSQGCSGYGPESRHSPPRFKRVRCLCQSLLPNLSVIRNPLTPHDQT